MSVELFVPTPATNARPGVSSLAGVKVAVVHEWLTTYAGSEQVLEQILGLFPNAALYSLIDTLDAGERGFLRGKDVRTSFLQRFPFVKKFYRTYLPLMPLAVEQLDLRGYDIVITNSHAVAKGVITGPDQLHICYCHSPMRYAWDLQHQYLEESDLAHRKRGILARFILHYLRMWDLRTANGVDLFVANSNYIARRIKKAYGRPAEVIYPPVNIDRFKGDVQKEDFYVTVSRMVPYKRVPLVVEAFGEMPDRKLIVIGKGPELDKVRKAAKANVTVLGYVSDDELLGYMQRAKAFVFAAEEDFGIAPVEAQAAGTPVIAYGRGGALESIHGPENPRPTGLFFYEQSVAAIVAAVNEFEAQAHRFTAANCRANAETFSIARFAEEFEALVKKSWSEFLRLQKVQGRTPALEAKAL